jgi:hypothetical protein
MTDLDGQPVSDPDQLMDTLRGLLDGTALTATVQRAGTPASIRLDGSDVQRLRTASSTGGATLSRLWAPPESGKARKDPTAC